MRLFLMMVIAWPVAGCGVGPGPLAALTAGGSFLTVPVFGRSLPDMVVSAIRDQDCSIVRLEQGKSYCRPTDPPPEVPRLCTRSLASVDCWVNPQELTGAVLSVADGPSTLTPAQEAYRTRGWP